jgi:hypothetical protein
MISASGGATPDRWGWLQRAWRARRCGRRGRLQLVQDLELDGYQNNERLLVWDGSTQDGQQLVMVAYAAWDYAYGNGNQSPDQLWATNPKFTVTGHLPDGPLIAVDRPDIRDNGDAADDGAAREVDLPPGHVLADWVQ